MAGETTQTTPTADECKALLERIATALESIQEAQVFIVADLVQIKTTLGLGGA